MSSPTLESNATSSDSESTQNDWNWTPPSQIRAILLMAGTGVAIYGCFQLISPFIPAVAWALTLAVLFSPLQSRLERTLKSSSLSAGLSVLVIGLMLVIPLSFALQSLILQASLGAQLVEANVESGQWRESLAAQPFLAPWVERFEQQFDLPGAVKTLSSWLSTTAVSIVKGSLFHGIELCITFYLLFFMLRDRGLAIDKIQCNPLFSALEMKRLFSRIQDTIHATIYGTIFVAAVQGGLGGFMFWCLGLPAPWLWGLVMALLSMIPMVGSPVVWLPTAILLGIEGSLGRALILSLWGLLVIGTIDNLIRPVLVGNRLRLHTALAFLSVVGGLLLFGPSGMILGPLLVTTTLWLFEIWSMHLLPVVGLRIDSEALSRFENEGGATSQHANGQKGLRE